MRPPEPPTSVSTAEESSTLSGTDSSFVHRLSLSEETMSFYRNTPTEPSTREKYLDTALAFVIGCILGLLMVQWFTA